jgi:hypothetical protein
MAIELRLPRADEQHCGSCSYPRPATSVIDGLPQCDQCSGARLVAEPEKLGALLALILRQG